MEALRTKWWLEGNELCGFCFQRYVYEERYHCVDCDEEICPQCVTIVRERNEVVCPNCVRETSEPNAG